MNRILKRPMFRMGGRSDDGIMSVRPGYAEGDSVRADIKKRFIQVIYLEIQVDYYQT